MRLSDLFGRSRPRSAPRPSCNRVRCRVEQLEPRLALSSTDPLPTAPTTVTPPPTSTTAPITIDPNTLLPVTTSSGTWC